MIIKNKFQLLSLTGLAITGLTPSFTALAGTGVRIKNDAAAGGDPTLELAQSDGGGFILTRDVLSVADYKVWFNEMSVGRSGRSDIGAPTQKGDAASARQAKFAEYETSDHLDASIDNTLLVGDALYWSAGKLALVDGAQFVCAYFRGYQPLADDANAVRVQVEFVL
jgi:hypothetical protein